MQAVISRRIRKLVNMQQFLLVLSNLFDRKAHNLTLRSNVLI